MCLSEARGPSRPLEEVELLVYPKEEPLPSLSGEAEHALLEDYGDSRGIPQLLPMNIHVQR